MPRYAAMLKLGAIHTRRSEADQIRRFSGSVRETTARRAVVNLINAYTRPRGLLLCEEFDCYNPAAESLVR